jgi:hypothetical protein
VPKPDLVILRIERPRPVEVDSWAWADASHGHELERGRFRRFASLQGVVQRLGDEGADADAAVFGLAAHLLCKPVV